MYVRICVCRFKIDCIVENPLRQCKDDPARRGTTTATAEHRREHTADTGTGIAMGGCPNPAARLREGAAARDTEHGAGWTNQGGCVDGLHVRAGGDRVGGSRR